MTNRPKLSVTYCDYGILLQTATSDKLVIPPSDAVDIAYSLLRAVDEYVAHTKLIGAVNDSFEEPE